MKIGDRVETRLYLQPRVRLHFGRQEERYVDAGLRGTIKEFGTKEFVGSVKVRFDDDTRDWIASTVELRLI